MHRSRPHLSKNSRVSVGCLLGSLLMTGCVADRPCSVEVVNYDSDSGLSQRYQASIERLSEGDGYGSGRVSLVHLFAAHTDSIEAAAENSTVSFAITDQRRQVSSAEKSCTGSIAACSAIVVDLARASCGPK